MAVSERDVDSVDPASAPDLEKLAVDADPALVWWLVDLARKDREMYRRVRALAWKLAAANSYRSAIPNNLS